MLAKGPGGPGFLGHVRGQPPADLRPTTWGALADIVPAHADLYFRRFQIEAQPAGIYMAGAGAAWALDTAYRLVCTFTESRRWRRVLMGCVAAGAGGWLWPAYSEIAHYDHSDANVSGVQRQADATDGPLLAPLVAYSAPTTGAASTPAWAATGATPSASVTSPCTSTCSARTSTR